MSILSLGAIELTAQATQLLSEAGQSAESFLQLHEAGHWEVEGAEAQAHNLFCAQNGLLVAAEFELSSGAKILIVTASDRSLTRVQASEEFQQREVSVAEGYGVWASSYDTTRNALVAVEEPIVQMMLAGQSVDAALDLGTGTGRHLERLAGVASSVIGLDISMHMLEKARQKERSRVTSLLLAQADIAHALPIASKSVGIILCSLVLSHVDQIRVLFQEVRRLLPAGGMFVLSMFHAEAQAIGWRTSIQRPDGVYRLPNFAHTEDELREALSDTGFQIDRQDVLKIANVPEGYLPPTTSKRYADTALCVVISARGQ
jgi:ubiquinone/menaquinone biosynthesis C-methylase UbiE